MTNFENEADRNIAREPGAPDYRSPEDDAPAYVGPGGAAGEQAPAYKAEPKGDAPAYQPHTQGDAPEYQPQADDHLGHDHHHECDHGHHHEGHEHAHHHLGTEPVDGQPLVQPGEGNPARMPGQDETLRPQGDGR